MSPSESRGPMDPQDWQGDYAVVMRAFLSHALKSARPVHESDAMEPPLGSPKAVVESAKRSSQGQFRIFTALTALVSKGALGVAHWKGSRHYVVKNRFHVQNLVDGEDAAILDLLPKLLPPPSSRLPQDDVLPDDDPSPESSPPGQDPGAESPGDPDEDDEEESTDEEGGDPPSEEGEDPPADDGEDPSEEANLVFSPPVARPKRIDAGVVYDLVVMINERQKAMAELQIQFASNLVFLKEELVSQREKDARLSRRLRDVEAGVSLLMDQACDPGAVIREEMAVLREELSRSRSQGVDEALRLASAALAKAELELSALKGESEVLNG
jgi:hypothetical protein